MCIRDRGVFGSLVEVRFYDGPYDDKVITDTNNNWPEKITIQDQKMNHRYFKSCCEYRIQDKNRKFSDPVLCFDYDYDDSTVRGNEQL